MFNILGPNTIDLRLYKPKNTRKLRDVFKGATRKGFWLSKPLLLTPKTPPFWKQKQRYLRLTLSGSYQVVRFTPVQIN